MLVRYCVIWSREDDEQSKDENGLLARHRGCKYSGRLWQITENLLPP